MKTAAVLLLTFSSGLVFAQDTVSTDTTKRYELFRPHSRPFRGLSIKSFDGIYPLYVVDGHIMTVEELEEIDGRNIASISVLKNGTTEKIFGDREKNGVILIKMKENFVIPKKD